MFAESVDDPEVALLLDLVATPPRADMSALHGPNQAVPKASDEQPLDPEAAARIWATTDLLGLEIDALPAAAVEPKLLADPELTRALEPEEQASLPERTQLVMVRALYRNQNGVRGLRLLQALVRAVAADTGALVHDPDTLETFGPAAFAARRLQASLGNVADQVAVVPFIDPRQPEAVRLTTRGMRRFGSVDLELDGLSRDLPALQQATYFLHGMGLVMARLGDSTARASRSRPRRSSGCTIATASTPTAVRSRCRGAARVRKRWISTSWSARPNRMTHPDTWSRGSWRRRPSAAAPTTITSHGSAPPSTGCSDGPRVDAGLRSPGPVGSLPRVGASQRGPIY
ncbi:hypothetical protein [Nannocystis pusilla]|uniref:hypothetical protein n=1 Tax=Nannocystis pusilla TaxID=889268 RepID=UPI003B7DEB7A